jgi:tRNA (uracil-5-)-methyltransferase
VEQIAASNCREMVELYCGTGIFSIAAAEKIPSLRCHGVEIAADSIECAERNAVMHHVSDRCTFAAGDAASGIGKAGSLEGKILLIDPPRTGVAPETLDAVIAARPSLFIYISCGPDTLQRDLTRVCAAGFSVEYARAFDMFPATGHFESLVILSRKQHRM